MVIVSVQLILSAFMANMEQTAPVVSLGRRDKGKGQGMDRG